VFVDCSESDSSEEFMDDIDIDERTAESAAAAATRVDSWRFCQYAIHVCQARLSRGFLAGSDGGSGAGGANRGGRTGLSPAVLARLPAPLRAKLQAILRGPISSPGRGQRARLGSLDSVETEESVATEGGWAGGGPSLESLVDGLGEEEVTAVLGALTAETDPLQLQLAAPSTPLSGWIYAPLRGSLSSLYARPLLPVPLLRLSLSQVLGAVTFVTFVDDEVGTETAADVVVVGQCV
jgi:hypothetical protein